VDDLPECADAQVGRERPAMALDKRRGAFVDRLLILDKLLGGFRYVGDRAVP
jgi:hypothetical protein